MSDKREREMKGENMTRVSQIEFYQLLILQHSDFIYIITCVSCKLNKLT